MQLFLRLRSFRSLWRSERGNALTITAFALPFVIAAAGLGIHTTQLSLTKRQLQRQADSAAIAGTYSLYQGRSNDVAKTSANKALTQNDLVANITSTLTPGVYSDGSGNTYTTSMYVRVQGTVATPFMSMFGQGTSTIAAEARAAVVPEGRFCFYASEDQVATGVTFQGNSKVDLGCGVGTNAKGGSAVVAGGSATVIASPVAAMGSVPYSANYAAGTVLMSNHSQIPDPFAGNDYEPDTTEVSDAACKSGNQWIDIDVPSGSSMTGNPGCYGTINVKGTLTLSAGIYYLANGANNAGLQVGAQGRLICDGCVFVLTSTTPENASSHATMNINGGAELDLSPPGTGHRYEGITVYRDARAAATNQCCTINGNANSTLSGAFYFPADELTFNGTQGMVVNCFQMVGRRLKFTGDAEITNSCDPPGDEPRWRLDKVRLVS